MRVRAVLACASFVLVSCQEDVYQQYMQQNQAPVQTSGAGMNWALLGAAGMVGWLVPNPFNGQKKKKDQKKIEHLYNLISLKNVEIQRLHSVVSEYEYQNQELKQALYESEQESLQRDYEEFKQPDANGDDVISRNEFSTYIRNYMKAYPHIPQEEYPTFDDFDMNRDGLVTFQEWQEYLYQQQLAEQQAAQYDARNNKQNAAVHNMYQQASEQQSFQAIMDQLQQQLKQSNSGFRRA